MSHRARVPPDRAQTQAEFDGVVVLIQREETVQLAVVDNLIVVIAPHLRSNNFLVILRVRRHIVEGVDARIFPGIGDCFSVLLCELFNVHVVVP